MLNSPEIKTWVQLQSKDVQKHLTIKSKEDVGQLFRIDSIVPKKFSPRMPTTTTSGENSSVPRVCTSTSLVGCMFGYYIGRLVFYFFNPEERHESFDDFLGGWYISELDYQHCIQPGDKLVPECSKTDEHWLVAYSKETSEYKPLIAGKMFLNEVHFFADREKKVREKPIVSLSFYIEISSKNGVQLDRKQRLEKGFYLVNITPAQDEYQDLSLDNKITIQAISVAEYKERKMKVAAMLSFQEPVSATWR